MFTLLSLRQETVRIRIALQLGELLDMTPAQAIRSCFANYAGFSGRAGRAEYWWFILFTVVALMLAGVIDVAIKATMQHYDTSPGPAQILAMTSLLVPWFAVTFRRMHDRGYSGFVAFAPNIIGVALGLVTALVATPTPGDGPGTPALIVGGATVVLFAATAIFAFVQQVQPSDPAVN